MNPRLARRLLGLSLPALVAYCYGRVEASFGIIPLLFFTAVGVVAWTAGYSWSARQFLSQTAQANRDRDLALARIAELKDGGRYAPVPISEYQRRRSMDKHPAGGVR